MVSGLALLILLLGAAGFVLAALFYLRGEVAVPGRPILLALRIGVLAVVVLLLLDVRLPGQDPTRSANGPATWLLLDADLSLLVPSEGGAPLWEGALERAAAESARGAGLALATPGAAGPEGTDLAGLRLRAPDHPSGDLVEGVARLGEAGADTVVVVSSFRRPPGFLEVLARATPVPVRLEALGAEGARNAGIAELALPSVVPTGEPITGRVSIFGEGGTPGDSVTVEVRRDGAAIQTVRLPLPGPGVEAAAPVALPPLSDIGLVRFTAEVTLEGDVFAADDSRASWVRAGEPEGGVLLVSLTPDWEPRYLLPVLEAVTGLEGEGYLALGGDRFLPLGEGGDDLGIVGPESFRERLAIAALLVVHGVGDEVPDWLASGAARHPAVLHLALGPAGAALAGVSTGTAAEGEWALDAQLPPSPVSSFLAGVRMAGLPPLEGLLPLQGASPSQVVLRGRGVRGGSAVPLLVLVEAEGARRGVALAGGFWRWGSRDGEAREAYRALWGGVANWLLTRSDPLVQGGVRPVAVVQPRGVPLRWEVAPGTAGSELSLSRVQAQEGAFGSEGSGASVFRGVLDTNEDGVASTPSVDPGVYRFEVRASGAGLNSAVLTSGLVEVEEWAPSLRYPPLALPAGLSPSRDGGVGEGGPGGRPLRTHPLPYLLALGLLCAEWLGRRRAGLR